ncbi:MAG: SH3 domain-containing protein [Pleurocapsa minor GSE-CHR-MK-17-07R]|jgi:hypothetical protein|nr:SH3 domain-containing protein [Pleurocapsa minor GSE-CHR-MK 17-07R]
MMRNHRRSGIRRLLPLAAVAFVLAACGAPSSEPLPPTATLAPIVSMTPRFTATPIPTRTALPTQTFTPSTTFTQAPPTNTFTPSPTAPITGSVFSVNDVNLREGPGVTFPLIDALRPGTGFIVVATDTAGNWFNIRLDNGDEGWISGDLVRLEPTQTPIPSATPSPDLTQMAQGTPLPTSVLGGQPVTPTPPAFLATAAVEPGEASPTGVRLPDMLSIDQTATALAGGSSGSSLPVTPFASGEAGTRPAGGPTGGPFAGATPTVGAPIGNSTPTDGVDVLAYCDNPIFGVPAPNSLTAGSAIDVFWVWIAATQQQINDHNAAANYDVRLDGVRLSVSARPAPRQQADGSWAQYYYARSQPLARGPHTITYSVTWSSAIFDGTNTYGPGGIASETGTCTFTVR